MSYSRCPSAQLQRGRLQVSRDFLGNLISLFPFHFRAQVASSSPAVANMPTITVQRKSGELVREHIILLLVIHCMYQIFLLDSSDKGEWLGRDCVSAELLSVCCSEHSKVEAVIVVAVARGSPAPSSAAAPRHRDGADTGDRDTEDTQETSQRGWRREALSIIIFSHGLISQNTLHSAHDFQEEAVKIVF